ncbi:hypothetical protein CY34DRAFT_764229 [Suillus luteus UH-Slu-Lm8-n1]|uniref:Uncharacterized protein n=1 Tax=Suillus luteus UH-Slu-Lm8-n1 TaxID=930992 RepID=A0A0D0BX56_9AGAM|nr:hypothetical protein CY34DRAFT_764229 [Suillus luteus UH-Slu-Lm8-n1]
MIYSVTRLFFIVVAVVVPSVYAHIAFWHPSMWGFNVTDKDPAYSYDNRPVTPLARMTFDEWWFHNHLRYPPHPNDVFELPAGKAAIAELGCNKGATTWWNSSEGGDVRQGDWPCPRSTSVQFHTKSVDDVKGCALAIVQESDVSKIKPEDFTVFSVNQTCVWHRFTTFQVPADMPACPGGKCTCAWFWIHSPDSGSEQMYMNAFQCTVTGSKHDAPALMKPQVARRCGADPEHGITHPTPSNCTHGAKQPLYWLQNESNNMFEDYMGPPFYNDLYDFKDGAQNDIFVTSTKNPAHSKRDVYQPSQFSRFWGNINELLALREATEEEV